MTTRSVRRDLALDFVSPLPPVRSGISDYSADLIPALGALCDLRVVRVDGQEVADELVERWQPVSMAEIGADGRVPFYQMGNNVYHLEILDRAHARPGLLTLHDLFLHHLLHERTLARGEIEPYRETLVHDHGWIGAAVAEPPRWNAYGAAPLFSLPCHRRLIQLQRGVLVHSQWAADRIAEDIEDAQVRVIPMPMPLRERADRSQGAELRRRFGIPEDAPVLGSFGFQTPIKRTDVVIEALARPELTDVHLLIVGVVTPSFDLAAKAAEAGASERVHLCGYLSRDELGQAMATADLCVNLRYPTAGETSASLLRLLAMGRPSLVSDYAQFAELPDACALKVVVGDDEVEALATKVRDLLETPGRLEQMGDDARAFVAREHDPDLVARRIVDACVEFTEHAPGTPTAATVPAPTSLTSRDTTGTMEVQGFETWPAGEARDLEVRLKNTGACRWLGARRGAGGVSLWVQVWDELTGIDINAATAWPELPLDLNPGSKYLFRVPLRRPLGPARLRILPMVTGAPKFEPLAVAPFESSI
ncbi:MAG: glycosyltransferase family 4 protein [Acidobacteriota bacterium]|nr:glycosyltransferase family 4 protein [Acidobacteriota bacterium]